MKLSVKADAYQFLLLDGEKVIGHYTTILTMLEGARRALRRKRTLAAAALQDVIANGIAHEARTLEQLRQIAREAAALPQPGVKDLLK